MNHQPKMSKIARRALSAYRKRSLAAKGLGFGDLQGKARVSYSMVRKWMNAQRNSERCENAFLALTGRPAKNEVAA